MARDGGVEIKVLAEQLGRLHCHPHRDTHQSVTKELQSSAADAVANTIDRRRPKTA
ncbi:hypothetical protein ACL02O_04760 [Micromonospora sp. MS34]|uniref:hypothetical protein n=1 Tax=Micromonospora sp. MS34 TaxID=3385971 RepID=UPI0039A31A15